LSHARWPDCEQREQSLRQPAAYLGGRACDSSREQGPVTYNQVKGSCFSKQFTLYRNKIIEFVFFLKSCLPADLDLTTTRSNVPLHPFPNCNGCWLGGSYHKTTHCRCRCQRTNGNPSKRRIRIEDEPPETQWRCEDLRSMSVVFIFICPDRKSLLNSRPCNWKSQSVPQCLYPSKSIAEWSTQKQRVSSTRTTPRNQFTATTTRSRKSFHHVATPQT
jgi:hypothetical protein